MMNRLIHLLLGLLLLQSLILFSPPSEAHNRSQSFSSWDVSDNLITAIFTVKTREITRLQISSTRTLKEILDDHLTKTVRVTQDNKTCASSGIVSPLPAKDGYIQVQLGYQCASSIQDIQLEINSFFDVASSHVHYAHVALNEMDSGDFLFSDSRRQHQVGGQTALSQTLHQTISQFYGIGFQHIISGLDHIAFLLVLLLLIRRLKDVIWLITGFTLGHSVTLALSAVGLVIPELRVVEAAIGFTIALVAAENIATLTGFKRQITYCSVAILLVMVLLNLLQGIGLSALSMFGLIIFTLAYMSTPEKTETAGGFRLLMSATFGLVHGFGFASALTEMGLTSEQLFPALLGFNIGIEVGQLLMIAGLWIIIQTFQTTKYVNKSRLVIDLVSASACGLGLYWFIGRTYGII